MAGYQFEFDSTEVGDFLIEKNKYRTYHKALLCLVAKLSEWNDIALKHGALQPPYEQELDYLQPMIKWGNERLQGNDSSLVTIPRISVASVRLYKAALIYAAWSREKEIGETAKNTWPAAVVESLRGEVRRYHKLAENISYPPADILDELRPEYSIKKLHVSDGESWDVFVSHASEDKDAFVRPLAEALHARGISTWYDEFTLKVGDSLRRSIDRGLARSKFGVVVLSNKFFEKEWPQKELDGLVAREVDEKKVILPVWYGIDIKEIRKFSPMLADLIGIPSDKGVQFAVNALLAVIRPSDV